jgi:hypothetical protein
MLFQQVYVTDRFPMRASADRPCVRLARPKADAAARCPQPQELVLPPFVMLLLMQANSFPQSKQSHNPLEDVWPVLET